MGQGESRATDKPTAEAQQASQTSLRAPITAGFAVASLQAAAEQRRRVQNSHALLGLGQSGETVEDDMGTPRSKGPLGRCCAATAALRRRTQSLQAYSTFEDVERDDARRMGMLALSRDSDPIFGGGVFSNPRKLLSTVVPTLLIAPTSILSALGFAIGAALARSGQLESAQDDYDEGALTGASVLISFLVAFYLGYCCVPPARARRPSLNPGR